MDYARHRPALDEVLFSMGEASSDFIDRLIAAAREHLGADVAFLSRLDGDEKVVRSVEDGYERSGVYAGMRIPFANSYCYRLVRGELPNLVPDARDDARVRDLPITDRLDIGAYIGVPVLLPDGSLYGTLCCISHDPDPTLRERDARFMQVLADLIGSHIARHQAEVGERGRKRQRIIALMREGRVRMVFQPIVDLMQGHVIGVEALSRFDAEPGRGAERWFADAWDIGLGPELELHAVERALAHLPDLPEPLYLSINASPLVLQSEHFMDLFTNVDAARVVVEVTEHAMVEAYSPLRQALDRLRAMGVRIAVDDVGAGYSGLAHVLQVLPGTVKLDMQLNRGIGADPAKQALVAAAVGFASRTRMDLVAEGIETADEANTLRILGVRYGQGFHFALPGPLHAAVATHAH